MCLPLLKAKTVKMFQGVFSWFSVFRLALKLPTKFGETYLIVFK